MIKPIKILGWAICSTICTLGIARGQPAAGIVTVKDYIDREVERHRWELNFNVANVLRRGSGWIYGYDYLVKLNSKSTKDGKSRAWRFALSPVSKNGKHYFDNSKLIKKKPHTIDYRFAPNFVLGHEWQRSHGRTMFFGGVDLAGQLSQSKYIGYNVTSPWDDHVTGNVVTRFNRHFAWLATFLGAKLYLNHHISVSLESHVQFVYGVDGVRTWFENQSIARDRSTWQQIKPSPNYLVNLSYNL